MPDPKFDLFKYVVIFLVLTVCVGLVTVEVLTGMDEIRNEVKASNCLMFLGFAYSSCLDDTSLTGCLIEFPGQTFRCGMNTTPQKYYSCNNNEEIISGQDIRNDGYSPIIIACRLPSKGGGGVNY